MNERQHKLQERFDREVEIVRGAGGIVTTDDLRAHGEAMAYAALGDAGVPELSEEDKLLNDLMNVHYHWCLRHETPGIRADIRESIRRLRTARVKGGRV